MNTEFKKLEVIPFQGSAILAKREGRDVLIIVKKTCEHLGIRYDTQQKRIQKDPVLSQLSCICPTVAEDGKVRDMLCFNEQGYLLWLAKINAGKTNSEDLLIKYQLEAARVLEEHFFGDRTKRIEALDNEKVLVARLKRLNDVGAYCMREAGKVKSELSEIRMNRILLFKF